MQFNVYLDNTTAEKLKEATKNSADTRNGIIRKAINQWLDQTQNKTWPNTILEFIGDNTLPPFESHRTELPAPNEDPLA